MLPPAENPNPVSLLRVVRASFWVLYRVARNRIRLSAGKTFSLLFFPIFLALIAFQVYNQATQQRAILERIIHEAPFGLEIAAAQAAAVFTLDVLGLLLLIPAGMIRADGVAGKQRAAVDTELWLTLPLTGRQQIVARLAQATFLISFIMIFFLSHFIAPALSFTRGLGQGALLFLGFVGTASLVVFGGGVGLYALARRFLSPRGQGRLVTWSAVGMLPVLFASFAFTSHVHGRVTAWLTAQFRGSSLALLLAALHNGRLDAALAHAVPVLLPALLLAGWGVWAVEALGRGASDDLSPLGDARRYVTRPGERRPLSYLGKDLRLRFRDPIHRGAFIGSLISAGSILFITGLSQGPLIEALHKGQADGPAVMLVAFLCGVTALLSAGQWVPLEARALEFLRVSGIEPPWLLVRKGLCATVEVLALCLVPCATLVVLGGPRLIPPMLECTLMSLGIAWFVIGDSAARFPESRRDTRPFQFRGFMAGYAIIIACGTAIVYSHAAAIVALLLLAMGALGRMDAGIDAMTYLDDVIDRPPRVRFADAWLAGAVAALVQGLSAIGVIALAHRLNRAPPLLLSVMVAYSASALVLGAWAFFYLRGRLPAGAALLARPRDRGSYVYALGLGLLSAGLAAIYLWGLRRYFPGSPNAIIGVADAPLWARLLTAAVLVGVDPLAEEIFFRGWILRGLTERLHRPGLALLLQAVLFASLHPTLSYVPVFLLGLFAGLAVRRSGSLLPAVLVHAVHNALPALLLCLGRTG